MRRVCIEPMAAQVSEEKGVARVLDPKGRGGRSRRRILQYLLETRDATPYSIANEVFGSWVKFRPSVVYHITKMEAVGLVSHRKLDEEERSSKNIVTLTDRGRKVCGELGLGTGQSRRVEALLAGLNMMSPEPLLPELVADGRRLLNDRILDQMYSMITTRPFTYIFPHKNEGLTQIDPVTFCVLLSIYTLEKQEAVKQLSGPAPEPSEGMLKEMNIDPSALQRTAIYDQVRSKGLEGEFDALAQWMAKVRKCMPMCGEMEYWFNVVAGSIKFYSLMVNVVKHVPGGTAPPPAKAEPPAEAKAGK
jgi:DNA-binding PadR family transcriptional regulator